MHVQGQHEQFETRTADGESTARIVPGTMRAKPRPATQPAPPPDGRLATWLLRLGSLQVARPSLPVLVCALLTIVGALLATRLALRTELDQLLPQSQPSVEELHRVAARTAGVSNLFVVLEGGDATTLRALGDELVPKLDAIGPPWVGGASDGVQQAKRFLEPRSGLFASVEDLTQLRDDLQERWDWEVSNRLGTNLDEDEPPPPIDAARLRSRMGNEVAAEGRFPDGYYQSKDGKALVVSVRAQIPAGDLDGSKEALRRVGAVVDEVRHDPRYASVRVGYSGDLATSLEEYGAVRDDLLHVGMLGVGLVLGAVFLYYLRFRTLIALAVTIAAGCAWTFGVTELAIGHLNVATGFLFSIVAGNGVNFGIIYIARYLEARREEAPVADAIATAHRETYVATLTAALAAAAAYGSLGVTDFRGFKHFALIGGAGMVLCWLATYVLLPAVLVLLERVRPFGGPPRRGLLHRLRHRGTRYDAPFAFLIRRLPRLLVVGGAALTVAGAVLVVRYAKTDPVEYDMTHLRNEVGARAESMRLSALASEIVGGATADGMAIVTDRVDQVKPLVTALEARRKAAPADAKPFEAVHTIDDFVPERQAEKVPLLEAIRDKVVRARARGLVTDRDWAEIEPFLPPEDLRPYTMADLPDDVARPFTERDGTRGRIVYIEPTAGESIDDARYLIRWADAFRSTTLPDGDVVRGSGRAVVYADMLRSVERDAPKAVGTSLAMTALVVMLVFRNRRRAAIVLGTLLVGVAWLSGLLALGHVKLNFLNFIALPITFGIGVDYAVNVVQRWGESRGRGVLSVLESTGGAVVLCSLTTMLGYLALLGSVNQAVRSLGIAAVLGEVCCLLAAVLFLPATLRWRERRRARRAERATAAAQEWVSSQASS